MTDLVAITHWLALIGLTGAWIEARITPWPQWTVAPALLVFSTLVVGYAGLIGLAYS